MKYENGANKVNLERLVLIARVLEKPLEFFYKLPDDKIIIEKPTQHQRLCIELSRNFMLIQNPKQQVAVHSLVKSLVENQDNTNL